MSGLQECLTYFLQMVWDGPLPSSHLRKERFSNFKCMPCTLQGQGSHRQYHQKTYRISLCVGMNSFHLAILHGLHYTVTANPAEVTRVLHWRESGVRDANDYTTAMRAILEMRRGPSDAKVTWWRWHREMLLTIARSWFFLLFIFVFPLHKQSNILSYHGRFPHFSQMYNYKRPRRIIYLFSELFVLRTLSTSHVFN